MNDLRLTNPCRLWRVVFLGAILLSSTASAAPLGINKKDASEAVAFLSATIGAPVERRDDNGYIPPTLVYGTQISSSTLEDIPTTTQIFDVSTSVHAEPITITTSSVGIPTTQTLVEAGSTTSESLSSTSISTSTESTETTSAVISFSSSSSSEEETGSTTVTFGNVETTSQIATTTSETAITTSMPSTTAADLTSTSDISTLTSQTTAPVESTTVLPTDASPPPYGSDALSSSTPFTSSFTSETSSAYENEPTSTTEELILTTQISTTSDISSLAATSVELTSTAEAPVPTGYCGGINQPDCATGILSTSVENVVPTESSTESGFTTDLPSTTVENVLPTDSFTESGFTTIPLPSIIPTSSTIMSLTSTEVYASIPPTSVEPTQEIVGPTTTLEASTTSFSEISSSDVLVPTGSPTLGPGFTFIAPPAYNTSTTSNGFISVTSEAEGVTISTSSTDSKPATSILNTFVPSITTPDFAAPTTTEVVSTSTVESLTSTLELPVDTSTSAVTFTSNVPTSVPYDTPTSVASSTLGASSSELEVPSQTAPGGPDIVLPSSTPDAYMPYPTYSDVPSTSVTESEPVPTSNLVPSTNLAPEIPSTTEENVLPTETSVEPVPYVPTGTPGSPPDLVIPTTTLNGVGTNTVSGGGGEETVTVSSVGSTLYTTETSVVTLSPSNSPSNSPSAVPSPTTVFVTVVVPTAPTATVTQTETFYPSPSTNVPETSVSTQESVPPTGSLGTAPPDIIPPTSTIGSYVTGPPVPSPSTSLQSVPTFLETITVTNTKNVVITSYSTVIATAPEVIPVPTDSDILTTVFETATAVETPSNAPDFGNIISVSMTASYPAPLIPMPASKDNIPITTTIQMFSTYQGIELARPTDASSVSTATGPVHTGYVIGGADVLTPRGNLASVPGPRDAALVKKSEVLPRTLVTLSKVADGASYAPTAARLTVRAPVPVIETQTNASQRLGSMPSLTFVLIAVVVGLLSVI
ncbi:hypothetical protein ABW20_dc0104260 [Dactylellina cionopaga]|nr:hypothetical protein ABW20_dc0104260 [Dactylellina cionopaga]